MQKILIVGNYGTLSREIISIMSKAGWEIYMLVDAKKNVEKPPKVFEQFVFEYDSDSVREVINSVCPDVVIFLGRYDNSFDWLHPKETTMHFVTGLLNILMSCSKCNVKRFLFLSSQDVFSYSESMFDEDMPLQPLDERGTLMAQGEAVCLRQAEISKLDVVILRLDHPYGIPQNPMDIQNFFSRMCMEGLQTGKITVSSTHQFSAVFVNDAAELIYRVISADQCEHQIYHVSSEMPIDEGEAAHLMQMNLNEEVTIVPAAKNPQTRRILSCERAKKEFGFSIRYKYQDTIPMLCAAMEKNLKDLVPPEKKISGTPVFRISSRFRRNILVFLPYLVSYAAALFCFWLKRASPLGISFDNIDLYLMYVVIFGCAFGKRMAVFSSAVSLIFYLISSNSLFDLMIDYHTYIWTAMVFISGMLAGNVRDQLDNEIVEKNEEVDFLAERLTDIEKINISNQNIKQTYESRLIEYDGSLGKIYKITSDLNRKAPGEVLFFAAKTTGEIMGSKDVAIYQVANDRFCRLFSSTSEKARMLGKSVAYADIPGLYEALKEHKVYINKTLNMSLPMMANGIYNGDKLKIIIMIWKMKIENLTLYQANLLTILSYLIMLSLNRADDYMNALANERFIEGSRIMESTAFNELLQLYQTAKKNNLADYCLLRLTSADRSLMDWNNVLTRLVRNTDYIGKGSDEKIYILLPNASVEDASFVIRRLNSSSVECEIVNEMEKEK